MFGITSTQQSRVVVVQLGARGRIVRSWPVPLPTSKLQRVSADLTIGEEGNVAVAIEYEDDQYVPTGVSYPHEAPECCGHIAISNWRLSQAPPVAHDVSPKVRSTHDSRTGLKSCSRSRRSRPCGDAATKRRTKSARRKISSNRRMERWASGCTRARSYMSPARYASWTSISSLMAGLLRVGWTMATSYARIPGASVRGCRYRAAFGRCQAIRKDSASRTTPGGIRSLPTCSTSI